MHGPKLGELITTNEHRDAIHIAVLPVVASERLLIGQPIKFTIPGNVELVCAAGEWKNAVGIVDPFLSVRVNKGQQFWMFMMPNTITSLRHEWSHPAVDGTDTKALSEFWLREFAGKYGLEYSYVIDCAERYNGTISTGDSEMDMDKDDHDQLPHHLSVVLGREIQFARFSCAC